MPCSDSISNVAVPIVIVASSAIYSEGSQWSDVSGVFGCLTIVAMVLEPLSRVMISIPFLACSFDSLGRVEDYLLQQDLSESRQIGENAAADKSWNLQYAVELENVYIAMPGVDRPVIRGVNLRGRPGEVMMIYGPASSGKSTLLKAVLGELSLSGGRIRLASKYIAYCGQSTWLQNISIRDSILGQSEYIPARYRDVVYCCALNEDFSQLPQGHNTLLGNLGSSISGGQQQRVVSDYLYLPPLVPLFNILL
jgi:ABC-type bacteriocin/lantibiotic exporter with double-glycine peptidase domain